MKLLRYKQLSLLVLAFLLSACGFHLRGHSPNSVEIDTFALSGDALYQGVAHEVEQLAINQNIPLDASAPWKLHIGTESQKQWRASTSQDYSKNEYWLSIEVSATISHDALEYRAISFKREALFQDDSDALNSKTAEKNRIIEELQRQLAREILQRLAYIMHNPPHCDCEPESDETRP